MTNPMSDMPEATPAQPVGERLRRAREAAGLTTRQVADRLHIIQRFVEAIEAGDHDALPGTVFLKGYVRGYAELVSLDPASLLEDLDTQISMQGAAQVENRFQSHRQRARSKGLWLFLVIVVAAIGYAFWQGKQGGDAASSVVPETQSQPTDTPNDASDSPGIEQAIVSTDSDGSMKASVPAEQEQPEAPDLTDSADNAVAAPSEGFQNVEGAPETTESADEPLTTGAQEPVPHSTDSSPSSPVVGEPQGIERATDDAAVEILPVEAELVATFTGSCWFDARTGDGQREVGLFKAGDIVRLTGTFPLSLIVGNVEAVNLRVNDIPVDFSRFRVRNKRAEFQLTAEALVNE